MAAVIEEGDDVARLRRSRDRYKELRRRLRDVEKANDGLTGKLTMAKQQIRRLRATRHLLVASIEQMSKAGIQVPARVRGAIGNPLDVLNEVEPIFSGIESSEDELNSDILSDVGAGSDVDLGGDDSSVDGSVPAPAAAWASASAPAPAASTTSAAPAVAGAPAADDDDEELAVADKKRRPKTPRDPNAPKRPANAFTMYANVMRNKIKAEQPHLAAGDLARLLTAQWKTMTTQEKQPYYDIYEKEKNKFATNMAAYVATGAVPPKEPAAAAAPAASAASATAAAATATAAPAVQAPEHTSEDDDDEDDDDDSDSDSGSDDDDDDDTSSSSDGDDDDDDDDDEDEEEEEKPLTMAAPEATGAKRSAAAGDVLPPVKRIKVVGAGPPATGS